MSFDDGYARGLPRSYLRLTLLTELAVGPAHGYELLEQVRELGVRVVDAGGLYRTLRAMERDGVVSSWWESSQSGPPRRTYELTQTGRDALAVEEVELRATVGLLAELAERVAAVLPPTTPATT